MTSVVDFEFTNDLTTDNSTETSDTTDDMITHANSSSFQFDNDTTTSVEGFNNDTTTSVEGFNNDTTTSVEGLNNDTTTTAVDNETTTLTEVNTADAITINANDDHTKVPITHSTTTKTVYPAVGPVEGVPTAHTHRNWALGLGIPLAFSLFVVLVVMVIRLMAWTLPSSRPYWRCGLALL